MQATIPTDAQIIRNGIAACRCGICTRHARCPNGNGPVCEPGHLPYWFSCGPPGVFSAFAGFITSNSSGEWGTPS